TQYTIEKQLIVMGAEIYDELAHPHFKNPDVRIFKSVIGTALNAGGNTIGLLYFWSKQTNAFDHQLPLFKSITDQMSVALSNIIANEQLIEEKNFSNTLLKITEAVASVNNTQQLYKTIFDTIKPVFPFDELGLFALDDTGEMHYELIDDSVFDRSVSQKFIEEALGRHTLYAHKGSSVKWLMENGPIITSMKEIDKITSHPQNKYMIEGGLKSLIGGPLAYAGKAFGMLCFTSTKENFYTEKDIPLFKSIAEQISIAVANILANEEIEQRNLEKSVQISLMEGLNKETDWESRQKKFAQALERLFPADFIGFYYDNEGMDEISTGFEKIGFEEFRKVSLLDFLRITNLNTRDFRKVLKEEEDQLPFILENKEVFEAGQYLNPIRKASFRQFKLASVLALSMQVKERSFYIYIKSKQSHVYNRSHIDMFHRIAPSFAQSLEKSLDYEELLTLNKLLKQEKAYLKEEVGQQYNFEEMIGTSEGMQQVFEKISLVINTDTTILILGETGTGKELVARALHNQSSRKNNPFVKVNCATLPQELIESELFGHEKGAFTGAASQRIGKFELAHNGTIFLDEIGELPFDLQSKLLRVIQEKEFERLGGNKTIKANVRILAATNRNLEKEVTDGNFRSDLYFRLSVFPIQLPALRDRGEDIYTLAQYFLKRYTQKMGKGKLAIGASAKKLLKVYPWPGNIRELEHVIERSVLLTKGKTLELALSHPSTSPPDSESFQFKTLQEVESELIFETLKRCNGKISGPGGAAEMLGVPPSTLEYRMKRAGITKEMVLERKSR
ncbi:MAG: sigma 54-interacting transcriptional regulator, partial [Bacteroidota bacterium]